MSAISPVQNVRHLPGPFPPPPPPLKNAHPQIIIFAV